MKNKILRENILFVIGLIIVFIIALKINTSIINKTNKNNIKHIIDYNDDSTTKKINKDSSITYTNELLKANKELFLQLISKDSLIQRLQKVVKTEKLKPGNSAIAMNNTIDRNNITTPTKTAIRDTIKIDSISYLYPTYTNNFVDDWFYINTIINKDSSNIKLSIKTEYDIILKEEGNIFKRKPVVKLHSYNPYVTTTNIKAFTNEIKPKKYSLGLQLGYGLQSNLSVGFYVGAGINYNLLRF